MSSSIAEPQATMREVLKHRGFTLLFSARTISDIGNSLTGLALLILINRLTGSATAIAGMTIILLVPQIIFGLLSGVFVDRLNRKHIMIVSDLLRGLLVLSFCLVTTADQIWMLYLIGFMQASIGTFFDPAQNSILPMILPKNKLLAANSLIVTGELIAVSVGGGLAGITVGITGAVWPIFVVDALSFFASVALVLGVRIPYTPPAKQTRGPKVILNELGDGLKITYTNRILRGTMVAAGVALLGLGAVNVLFVPLLVNELKSSESWLGPIQVMTVIGAVAGSSTIGILAKRMQKTSMIVYGLIILAIVVSLDGLVTAPWQLIPIQFIIGWAISPVNIAISTLNQTAINDEIRGRVISARMTIGSISQIISMSCAGVLADVIGVRTVLIAAGGFVLAASFGSSIIFRGYHQLQDISTSEPALK